MTETPTLRPLGEPLGTEVLGIDLSRPLDEPTFVIAELDPAVNPPANALRVFGKSMARGQARW